MIEKLGSPVSQELFDSESDVFMDVVVSAGSLPAGITITRVPGPSHIYGGTPTVAGHYDFTMTFKEQFGRDKVKTCRVDVVPSSFSVERIAGADRYEESVLISKRVAPTTSKIVYIASGENFADALSGSAVAAQRNAPMLLSTSSTVPASVRAELARLNPADVVILGGEKSLTPAVVSQLQASAPGATVTRIGGADRFAVSRNLISDPKFGASPSTGIFLASGRVFPRRSECQPGGST